MTNMETDSIIQKKSLAEEVAEQLQKQIKEEAKKKVINSLPNPNL